VRFVLAISFVASCSSLFPHTTEPAARDPIVVAPGEAVVVLYRPSAYGAAGPVDSLPVAERWSVMRVLDDNGDPIADLRATEHAVVRMAPGVHELFASNWTGAPYRECIGAMRGELVADHVYFAYVYSFGRMGSRKGGCARVDLVAVTSENRAGFAAEIARSERVRFLGTQRQHGWLIDDLDRRLATVAQGRLRMTDDPSWSAARSTLTE
jgi:hypothetical protein